MAKKASAKKPAAKKATPHSKTVVKKAPTKKPLPKPVPKKSKSEVKSKPASKPPLKAPPAPTAPIKAKAPPSKPAAAPEVKKATSTISEKPSGVIPLTVNAQGSGGNAGSGNTHPANILVVVSQAGVPVTELQQSNFTVMEHFTVPGQQYPFSNNIVTFRNVGSGAYLIQVKPINNAPWSSGHHLAQIIVSSRNQQGITAVKIIVR